MINCSLSTRRGLRSKTNRKYGRITRGLCETRRESNKSSRKLLADVFDGCPRCLTNYKQILSPEEGSVLYEHGQNYIPMQICKRITSPKLEPDFRKTTNGRRTWGRKLCVSKFVKRHVKKRLEFACSRCGTRVVSGAPGNIKTGSSNTWITLARPLYFTNLWKKKDVFTRSYIELYVNSALTKIMCHKIRISFCDSNFVHQHSFFVFINNTLIFFSNLTTWSTFSALPSVVDADSERFPNGPPSDI